MKNKDIKNKKSICFFIIVGLFFLINNTLVAKEKIKIKKNQKGKKIMVDKPSVFETVLDNGLTVLVRPVKTIPKVSVHIWYKVGSKDEKDGEKGLAHLIEHMLFKGTEKLSESDIKIAIQKLSGYCNAFTSYDFTGYNFDMPTHHWKKVLPIIADCMTNASFKDEHLNSEMKTVIQELKMINDQHTRSLVFKMLTLMFTGHPYHYPLIGYKQDLWTVRGKDLKAFYKKHYLPNNATLIVVGDVQPEEVFELAKNYFGKIKPNKNYKKEKFYLDDDIVSRSITLYRDITLPEVMLAFKVPGAQEKGNHTFDVASLALANGKSSRLHKKLVDDLQLVTSIGSLASRMFDHGIFIILFEPKNIADIEKIESIIFDEIEDIAKNGLKKKELVRSTKIAQMQYYSKLENISAQASDIGRTFLATGDKDYAFNYLDVTFDDIQRDVKNLLSNFFRPAVAHKGMIFPLEKDEKKHWTALQEKSDLLDTKILSARVRTTPVEAPCYANSVNIEEPTQFDFPKPKTCELSNGVKVFHYHNANTPKIDLVLSLKAKHYYDPDDKQGLYNFVMSMLAEGTKKYSAAELADELESRGISFSAAPGFIVMSMLSSDLDKGLEILQEILSNALFKKDNIEKVREQIYAQIKEFWDSPMAFSGQIMNEHLYSGHPYSKNALGTKKMIAAIQQKDLKEFYKNYIVPFGARLSVVGDFSNHNIEKTLEKHLASWSGKEVKDIEFPEVIKTCCKDVDYFINRDQVVLCIAGLSVDRKHEDYDKLLLFDQIFSGGVLHSMNSRLIQLREQSGLFYTIGGSLTSGANEQPGAALVKTIVSVDRLQEAEEKIKKTIDFTVDQIDEQEFKLARLAIVNSLANYFESNTQIATAFLFLNRFNLPEDYFDKRAEDLLQLTIAEVQEAVKKVLNSKNMITIRIGRVGKPAITKV